MSFTSDIEYVPHDPFTPNQGLNSRAEAEAGRRIIGVSSKNESALIARTPFAADTALAGREVRRRDPVARASRAPP
jgi:hypothetical protein